MSKSKADGKRAEKKVCLGIHNIALKKKNKHISPWKRQCQTKNKRSWPLHKDMQDAGKRLSSLRLSHGAF